MGNIDVIESQESIKNLSKSIQLNSDRNVVLDFLRKNGVIIGMIVVLIIFQIINPKFLVLKNVVGVINQSSLLIIMSVGMMMAMSVRAVDLSIAQVADSAGLFAAILLLHDYPIWLVFLIPIVFGMVTGAFNGLLVSYLGIPAIIGTLGTMFIVRSIELVITHGAQPQVLFTLPLSVTDKFFFLGQGIIGSVPFLIIFMIIVVVIAHFIRHRTVLGRHMDAVEGNVKTAFLSAINIRKAFGLSFVIGAILSAIAGIALTSRTAGAVPRSVESYLLDCFVAVYLGVLLTKRNKMSVFGTAFGALFVGFVSNWINIMELGAPYKYAINGIIILLALSIGALKRDD
ncbi:MAG: ABC transporter permease [Ruminiclostridium sp.]